MSPTRKWLLYSVYSIVITVFFLYLQFPSDVFETFIVSHANQIDPRLRLTVERIKPSLPPGIDITAASVHYGDKIAFTADTMRVVPKYETLFRPDTVYRFAGRAHGGRVNGELTRFENDQVRIEAEFSGIQVSDISAVQAFSTNDIAGVCDGTIGYQNRADAGGVFNTKISISNCTVALATPLPNLDALTFSRITAEVVYDNDRLQIKNCSLNSRQGTGKLAGTIQFRQPRESSRVDLTGSLKPNRIMLMAIKSLLPENLFAQISSGNRELTIRIRGTIGKPNIMFN